MEGPSTTVRSIGFPKNRIEALTDGVFAFAMTLMVIGLVVPADIQDASNAAILEILVVMFPDFFHYVLAFFVLATFWVVHHAQVHRIRHIDSRFLWFNIVALMFVAMVPFSTTLVGDYPEETYASIVFEANLLLIGLFFAAQWWYASKDQRLVYPDTDVERGRVRVLVVPAVSLFAILLALAGIPWSTAVYMLIPVVMALLPPGR
jgi:uncharacterized membrane protein